VLEGENGQDEYSMLNSRRKKSDDEGKREEGDGSHRHKGGEREMVVAA